MVDLKGWTYASMACMWTVISYTMATPEHILLSMPTFALAFAFALIVLNRGLKKRGVSNG